MKYQISDIVENELCTGCGICVSESTSSHMIWDENGFLIPKLNNSFNERAIKLCPFNLEPEEAVQDEDRLASQFFLNSKNIDKQVGHFENIYVGYSINHRKTSSSGGIATYVFEQLLERKFVDHLFIVKEYKGSYSYQWFSNLDKIREISKTQYIPVTLENLFKEIDSKDGKIAVSGVSCFIKAIRLKQYYYPEYREKISFLIGIICGGLKSRFFTDYLAQKSGIEGAYNKQQYRIKDAQSTASDYSFGAFNGNGQFLEMKMRTVGDMWGTGLFKSNACDFCDDVTNELADISLGDAWLAPYSQEGLGTSVIVTRTDIADSIVSEGIAKNQLAVTNLELSKFNLSQAGSFKHRHSGLEYRMNLKAKEHKLVPKKRMRFLTDIPFEFKMVQKQRMLVREESLEVWKVLKSAKEFDTKLFVGKKNLFWFTRIYHQLQKLRKILGLKTL